MHSSVDLSAYAGFLDRSLLQDSWADILEHLPDAVFIVTGEAEGRIRYLNAQATQMFGYERSELIGRSIESLIPPHLRDQHARHRDGLHEHGAAASNGRRPRAIGAAPKRYRISHRCHAHHIGNRTPPVTVAVVRDMSEHQRLQAALTQARDSAVRANQVKSRFLAAASHDLRQPLQTVWSLQSVLTRALKNSEFAPHLGLLEEAVQSMDQILSALMDVNRLEMGAIQPVIRDFPLREILPRLRSELGYAAASKSLELDIDDSTEIVRSDPMLLPVILRNLIGNAIKYTLQGTIQLRVRPYGAHLYIDIIDTGPGIATEQLNRIFDDFYQIGQSESRPAPRGRPGPVDRADDLPAARPHDRHRVTSR